MSNKFPPFSRQREQKRQVIHLDTVVKKATKFLRASLPAQIKIDMNLADATQIYQVTMNLATNALHAIEGRPRLLTIKLESFLPDAAFRQRHAEFRNQPYARLIVADTGRGLAVVHGIVQSHDGELLNRY